ncbi:MAG: hypothetical protein JSV36_12730 [Anaerolineae bacterium]|nr:MAG: hypothetical protein JSV36_12730 [Anaerolineae bacterium]
MSLANVRLSLLVGPAVPRPAPRLLMNALESVQVNASAEFAQGFELTFRAERDPAASRDYALLTSPLLNPGSRVLISVTLNATPRVLMDGVITHHSLTPSSGAAGTSLSVKGEDLSVLMDMTERAVPHPPLPDEAIVLLILAGYATYGVAPRVIPAPTSWTTSFLDQTPFQRGTDRAYLRELASHHGYTFGIRPGPVPLTSIAYWGPPDAIRKDCPPQKPLTVDMGPATNVESISFSYNALAPEQVYGYVADPDVRRPVSVLTTSSTRKPHLASRPALTANEPFVKRVRLDYKGHDSIEAKAKAQDRTDKSTDGVVTASGELDALRYGDMLTAPGIVGLRGAGYSYDGYYNVKSVAHTISRTEYTQTFTLAREGTGSLTQRV